MNDVKTSYLFWLFWLFGAGGIHRLYNRKIASGILYMVTWGFLGIGQIIDLVLIPEMVEEHNLRMQIKLGMSPKGAPLPQQAIALTQKNDEPMTRDQMMMKLAHAALQHGGKLSVTQGVLAIEQSFSAVEATLKEMVKSGYVAVENHPETGVILYNFVELS
ncbi:MAG: TM2 domain-containing protein [Microcoleus sp. SIO2G3]|nr:TM2 domain-containing protein [Microcoleus sp. SIO2G3]